MWHDMSTLSCGCANNLLADVRAGPELCDITPIAAQLTLEAFCAVFANVSMPHLLIYLLTARIIPKRVRIRMLSLNALDVIFVHPLIYEISTQKSETQLPCTLVVHTVPFVWKNSIQGNVFQIL